MNTSPANPPVHQRLLPLALAAYFAVASAITLSWPPWGDEAHYLETVRQFGQGLSVDFLRSYQEMTAPLSFILYAQWGHVFGFGTAQLRLLSPILAWSASLLLASALRGLGARPPMVLAGVAIVVLNPYFLGLSAFVFTDMLALLMLMLAIVGVVHDRAWMTGLGGAGAVLTRQYLAFLAPAVVAAAMLSEGLRRTTVNRHAVAACLALLPLAWLVWLWNGTLAPLNELRHNYLTGSGLRYNPHALALYVAAPGVYLAPLLLWRLRQGVSRVSVTCGLVVALLTLVFPIQPSMAQINEGSTTVGFAHRALVSTLPTMGVNAVWYSAAALWITVMAEAATGAVTSLRRHDLTIGAALPWAATAAFLALMPFSYMPWEKYAVPLFVLSALILAPPARLRP